MKTWASYFFKLFDNLSCETEIEFAELEIQGLLGMPEKVRNAIELFTAPPFSYFLDHDGRPQDFITWHLAPGSIHGFVVENDLRDISSLIARLAYTKEIYVVVKSSDSIGNLLKTLYPKGKLGVDVTCFEIHARGAPWKMFRIVTRTLFLENMKHIVEMSYADNKSRQIERIRENVDRLIRYAHDGYKLYPLFADSLVGKEIEDFFEIRTEIKLYLSHAFGAPYKGKFHPRMVKALINATSESGIIVDPFMGSGTTAIEATLMGLDSYGAEINPFCVKTTRGKIAALQVKESALEEATKEVISKAKERVVAGSLNSFSRSSAPLIEEVPFEVKKMYSDRVQQLREIYSVKSCVSALENEDVKWIMYAALGKVISQAVRAKKINDIINTFAALCWQYIKAVHAFNYLRTKIPFKLGRSINEECDARAIPLPSESIDAIVTSPAYSTAIDYVKNDAAQLLILEGCDLAKLNEKIIGSPRPPRLPGSTLSLWHSNFSSEAKSLPQNAAEIIHNIFTDGRLDLAARQYKYLKDMDEALAEMSRILKVGKKAVIIIGNNHFRVKNTELEFKNDEYLSELAERHGLRLEKWIRRRLTKTTYGAIQHESILIFHKE